MMLKLVHTSILRNTFIRSSVNSSTDLFSRSLTTITENNKAAETVKSQPSRPLTYKDAQLTNVAESKEDFEKYVTRILPNFLVPAPPEHESYPTPSGWMPPDYSKSVGLPYSVMRTRFHQFPIYATVRNGSLRLTRVRNIEGDIWRFDKDIRKHIEESIQTYENKTVNVYSQVNEIQRHVLIKGFYLEYINDFLLKCGF